MNFFKYFRDIIRNWATFLTKVLQINFANLNSPTFSENDDNFIQIVLRTVLLTKPKKSNLYSNNGVKNHATSLRKIYTFANLKHNDSTSMIIWEMWKVRQRKDVFVKARIVETIGLHKWSYARCGGGMATEMLANNLKICTYCKAVFYTVKISVQEQ